MAETDPDIPEATSAMQQLSPDAQHNSPPSSPDSAAAAEFEEEEDPVRICNESIVVRLG